MELTFSHSLAVITTILLNFSLCLLFLLLKIHKKKQSLRQENLIHSDPLRQNPHSNLTEENEKEKEEEQVKEKETPTKEEEKKRKKRTRKKKQEGASEDSKEKTLGVWDDGKVGKETGTSTGTGTGGGSTDNPFPFSSYASGMQRRIKLKYDELVSSNQAMSLTSTQVTQFIDCLIEARNELQHKSEVIQRSFKIKKALLSKANRSSFDRLCNQVFKLETEHKKLQEDAAVYNVLQEQLKLSPAYKTMLDISAKMKSEVNEEQMPDFADISFEELLAQEKKDSFWQKNGKMRSFGN